MSNPRPCVCGHPESKHGSGLPAFGNRCIACYFSPGDWSGCLRYRPAPRKEPLRAERRLCLHGRSGVVNMVDHIGFGPFVESVPGRVECPPACYQEMAAAATRLLPGRKGLVIFGNGDEWPIEVRAAPSQPSHSTFTVRWNDDRHAYEVRDSDGSA